ncbi:SDR family NAD(P)-dependent oxidoreductase [Candidatus Poribacteria bacterium]
MDLRGAVAVVTGGARGIGRAIAKAYADRGARVAIVDILADQVQATANEMREAGATVLPIHIDITIPSQVDEMVARVKGKLGPIDILVNNAGSLSALGPIWDVDRDKWFRDVTVNLYGTFLCCQAVVKDMIQNNGGYIINLTTGMRGPHLYTTGYDTSKTGVVKLTEALAKEAKEYGVKAFAMVPGAVLTDMTKFIMESPEGRKWRPTFKNIFEANRDCPPEFAASMAVELVGGKADALTGRYFDARSDLTKIIDQADEVLEKDRFVLRLR